LIFFYWGDWSDGVLLDPATALRASRDDVESDLSVSGSAPPRSQTVWFTTTEAGLATLDSLPREIFLEA
jgi:hypothetical protein